MLAGRLDMAAKTKAAEHAGFESALIDAGTVLQRVETLLTEARQRVNGGPGDQTIAAALTDAALDEVGNVLDEIERAVNLPAVTTLSAA